MMLFDFDGKARPSKKDAKEQMLKDLSSREELIRKHRIAREKRATAKHKENAATKIQALCRRHLCEKRVKTDVRSVFDRTMAGWATVSDCGLRARLEDQVGRLCFFFSVDFDSQRLLWLCQMCVSAERKWKGETISQGRLLRLYRCCVRYIEWTAYSSSRPFAPALRLLQVFALKNTEHTAIVLEMGYCKALRLVFERRVPLPVIEVSQRLPGPGAQAIADALLQPLLLLSDNPHIDPKNRQKVMRIFYRELLIERHSECKHLVCLLIPYMSCKFENNVLNVEDLLDALSPDTVHFDQSPNALNTINGSVVLAGNLVATPVFAYALLSFVQKAPFNKDWNQSAKVNRQLLLVLTTLLQNIFVTRQEMQTLSSHGDTDDGYDSDDSEDGMDTTSQPEPGSIEFFSNECKHLVDHWRVREAMYNGVFESDGKRANSKAVWLLCRIIYYTMGGKGERQSTLLSSCSFKTPVLRCLWNLIVNCTSPTIFGQPLPLLDILQRSQPLSEDQKDRLLPLIWVFCKLFSNVLTAVDDEEFLDDNSRNCPSVSLVPFTKRELVKVTERMRNVTLGLIDLSFPDSRTGFGNKLNEGKLDFETGRKSAQWRQLFDVIVHLVRLLHERDMRLHFMADGFWPVNDRAVVVNKQAFRCHGRNSRIRPFGMVRWLRHEEMEGIEGPQPSTIDLRNITIMRQIPFVVPFLVRVKIFHELLNEDKATYRGDGWAGSSINVHVRRNYLYEDAFEKLSPANAPDLRKRIRVSMANWAGMNEAGLDAGGIFREFLSEVLKAGFDPNRGFFTSTNEDSLLYPNPLAASLFPDDFEHHFFFLGRMLGKLIYEGQMAEMRFASFFIYKLFRKNNEAVDMHHLQSMDREFYRSLQEIKNFDGDFDQLALDFSLLDENLGTIQKVELKPNGGNIAVTRQNRIEYVHLVADYYLNFKLRAVTRAFRMGLADVLDVDWLGMFDYRELQLLISGTDSDVDVADMRANCVVSHIRGEQDEQYVEMFWRVLLSLSAEDKRYLLKFVTGCSRPPLMGFKDVNPRLGIQLIDSCDRLPSAATCMNLLKLPRFPDQDTLTAKLLYAIKAGAGFELS